MSQKPEITFGILTVSDSCAQNPSENKSGPAIKEILTDDNNEIGKLFKGTVLRELCIPDNQDIIVRTLMEWCDEEESVNVILTTGGTGFTQSDVTPEATKKVILKEVTGIPFAMMMSSLKITPMAMLSRAVSGIRYKTLIINLPGSPKAVKECLQAIAVVIPHAVQLILGIETKKHPTSRNEEISAHCSHSCGMFKSSHVADRQRQSPFPMISMEQATNILDEFVSKAHPLKIEHVPLTEAYGRVLAETVKSSCNLPPFRASVKDGYAVLHDDISMRKTVLGSIEAGQMPRNIKLTPGTCVRVNTGCPVPDDATAVVQVEDTQLLDKDEQSGEEVLVIILTRPKLNQDIRPIGCDIALNEPVLTQGTKLRSVEIGMLTACGCNLVPVFKVPKIGIMSTGNELQEPREEAKPGCVYDSNRVTLTLLLKEHNFTALDFGIVKDDESVMVSMLQNALERVDVLITTGSVSMGDRDMLKPILLKQFNATIHFGRVNMKPGKPTTFATCYLGNQLKYILCLPGNPVSATVTSYLFVLPLLRGLSGSHEKPVIVKAKLTFSYELDLRPDYVRTCLIWGGDIPEARSTGSQISSKLCSFENANALLMMPERTPNKTKMNVGDIVPAMLLNFNKNYQ